MIEGGAGTSRQRAEIPRAEEFSFWLPMRTRNRDTDQFGHVNHAALATIFEESRIALIFCQEMAPETSGIDLLIASISMEFHKELRAPGDIRVGAQVTRIGSSSLDIRQAVFGGGVCYASAQAICVLFGHESRRPVPVSPVLRGHLQGGAKLPS